MERPRRLSPCDVLDACASDRSADSCHRRARSVAFGRPWPSPRWTPPRVRSGASSASNVRTARRESLSCGSGSRSRPLSPPRTMWVESGDHTPQRPARIFRLRPRPSTISRPVGFAPTAAIDGKRRRRVGALRSVALRSEVTVSVSGIGRPSPLLAQPLPPFYVSCSGRTPCCNDDWRSLVSVLHGISSWVSTPVYLWPVPR